MKMTKGCLECCQIKNKSDVGKERFYSDRLLQQEEGDYRSRENACGYKVSAYVKD